MADEDANIRQFDEFTNSSGSAVFRQDEHDSEDEVNHAHLLNPVKKSPIAKFTVGGNGFKE